jgi:hypothetical protein
VRAVTLAISILLAAQLSSECALWRVSDGGCLATPAEFVYGRASTIPDAGPHS